MTSPKDLFLTKEDLRGQLGVVVSSDWFQECVCYAVAQVHDDHAMSAEQMQGIKMFLRTLRHMHEKEEAAQAPISTGLKPVPQLKR